MGFPIVHFNNWTYFIARSCPEGQALVKSISEADHAQFLNHQKCALMLLRKGRLESGLELLLRDVLLLNSVEGVISHILHRYHLPVLAYYHYCKEEFDRADDLLDLALEHAQQAIDEQRFLLPMAESAIEFEMQRVRIARGRRRWVEMRDRLDMFEAEMSGKLPLCVLGDGVVISIINLKDYYESLALSQEEREKLAYILDDSYRSRTVRNIRDTMYCLPGFVIGYP
jgi:hypothetical protein